MVIFFAIGLTFSTDIANINNKGREDAFILKYLVEYKLTNVDSKNGTFSSKQKNNLGIVTSTPNEGYELDEIIVKDENGNVMELEMTKLEDGIYSFPLYSDVSIEVLFKEILSNPKTGVFDYILFIMIGLLISFIGYISISYNNQKFEL